MKYIITALIALAVATPVFAGIKYYNVIEIKTPTWVIQNDGVKPTPVYKFQDGEVTCYVTRTEATLPITDISCVK